MCTFNDSLRVSIVPFMYTIISFLCLAKIGYECFKLPTISLAVFSVSCTEWLNVILAGTLTQNEMVFRRLHLGTVAYGMDSMDEVQSHVFSAYTQVQNHIIKQIRKQCKNLSVNKTF